MVKKIVFTKLVLGLQIIYKRLPAQVFSYKFFKILQNKFTILDTSKEIMIFST